MSIYKLRQISQGTFTSDDPRLVAIRRDFTGGINTRQHASRLNDNQVEDLKNWDISVLGELQKINGLTLIEDLGDDAGTGALGFEPRGGNNELLVTYGTKLAGWLGSGSFTIHKNDFSSGYQTTLIKATCSGENGDVVIISNGQDNVHQMLQDHTITDLGDNDDDCPKTQVLTFYRNRLWALKDNKLYWSEALPSTYDGAFDRVNNYYSISVGEEKAILGLREVGLICFGKDAVYGINPSVVPAATDKPEKILDIGCIAGKSVVQVGDDILFLATDGVRGVFRTMQDKLQMGQSFPLSYSLKTAFESISWAYIDKATAVYFDNKYLLALPVNSASYNNQVWVYYPALNSWMIIDGWNVGAWTKIKFQGKEYLYAIDSRDSSVYQVFSGYNNNGEAITSVFISREEDMGQPLNYKRGGELEIEADTSGTGTALDIYIAKDGGNFEKIGEIELTSSTAPTLPINLPFYLSDSFIVRKKFSLDSIGRWRTLQIKIENDDNNTDPVKFYGYNIITYLDEYEEDVDE